MNKILLILVGVFSVFILNAAAPPPPPVTGTPNCWPPPCVPIDGGISLLMAAGALYGGKKLLNKRKIKENN